ncbi:amidohydrolase [bacterium]|nr:amidohydrolase [bacterium]
MTRFVDVDVHPPIAELLDGPFSPFSGALGEGTGVAATSLDELADSYRQRDGKAVLLGWDAESATGQPPLTNGRVAELAADHPDVFFGFGAVDPMKGAAAFSGVHEAKRLGLRGISLHPAVQRFSPSDRAAYQVWEIAEELRLPVMVHTGLTPMGSGTAGGTGVVLSNADPMRLDRVAADFPDLTIIIAHSSWLWREEAIAVAVHKSNVWLALSGWQPDRIPEVFLDAVRGPLADSTVFGTGFPPVASDDRIAGWETLGLPEDVTRKVLADNALRLLEAS